jgi:hypothetical protein
MRFTERVLTSSVVIKPNSTPEMADETGCEVFMMADYETLYCACRLKQPKRSV